MAFRAATQRALNMRHMMNITRQPISITAVRPQSTLNTGEVLSDPQIGDYPNLPRASTQTRGPFGWDDPQDKRNFGEPVHEEDELFGVWAPNLHHYSPYKAAAQFALAATLFATLAGVVYKFYPDRPVVKRTYPYNGLTEEFGAREGDIRPRGVSCQHLI
ncbi:unnamed protein product [Mucor hiemalis]